MIKSSETQMLSLQLKVSLRRNDQLCRLLQIDGRGAFEKNCTCPNAEQCVTCAGLRIAYLECCFSSDYKVQDALFDLLGEVGFLARSKG
jgi:hypothetical protein